ncbi:tRNA uridine-5-carboxymethylaminomethyl(34) synthesis GTPase MnmE [Panacibacter ginsenosidivorans]|uniref:tRNA modification GTPase MnmE n=1 Tax=Panacibacter ginsenosidivorans TaxID=1813871 RepID=A0A5B8V453_9BACT|nr:tRNA uridine-5-carboxymethylaminomethyl(34) synthesis GTPase MnmE [Panacibacter ginsenosidivorans]QEC66164.1 tRNA uridine-5-carboxymethylaminomethyl(34) synthesis GTPase MnmE [Panacibacter ginsenosidivorans]
MQGQLAGWDDTIAALATPPGIGAIGVIRISGKKALAITDKLFTAKKISEQPSHTLHVGLLKLNDIVLDEVVVALFKSPRSYTGEDVIEISCHGSNYILQQVLQAITSLGARPAKPGEFTQRAFLNGKLDLAQAEAVADLIASNTEASKKAALSSMRGGFSEALKNVREQLLKFAALIELELDFSQEDVEFADRTALYKLVSEAGLSINKLISSFQLGNVIKNGVSVAIIGKPNAGKSTLLNALLNENRAIVSDIPGTTRDTIEEVLNIDGILFRLIDTAGIRLHTSDIIESAGIERSLEKMKHADLVLFIFDVTDDKKEIEKRVHDMKAEGLHYILVANKIDKTNEIEARRQFGHLEKIIFIAAKEGKHTETLKEYMTDTVLHGKVQTESNIVTNARHYHALKEAATSLEEIQAGLDNNLESDLLALDIRRCLHYLGEITGQVTNEDMLDYIFSKFCIGK